MISIVDNHLILQPKLNSECLPLRLPLLSGYVCPACDDVIYAAVKLEPGQVPPRINLYHENLNGNLVSYNALHLNPANGENGALYIETGHRKLGPLNEAGRYTSGRCPVVKFIIEVDPLRRALQFLRILGQVYALPNYFSACGKTGQTFQDVMAALEKHPESVPILEEFIRLRPRVVALNEVLGGPPAYALRHAAWDPYCFMEPCKKILEAAARDTSAAAA